VEKVPLSGQNKGDQGDNGKRNRQELNRWPAIRYRRKGKKLPNEKTKIKTKTPKIGERRTRTIETQKKMGFSIAEKESQEGRRRFGLNVRGKSKSSHARTQGQVTDSANREKNDHRNRTDYNNPVNGTSERREMWQEEGIKTQTSFFGYLTYGAKEPKGKKMRSGWGTNIRGRFVC